MSWKALKYYDNYQFNLMSIPGYDELGTCRTVLVSPEQPVLCIPNRPTSTIGLTVLVRWTLYTSHEVDTVPVCRTTEPFEVASLPSTDIRLSRQLLTVESFCVSSQYLTLSAGHL